MGHEDAHYWTSSCHNASAVGLEVGEQRPLMTSRGTGETKRSSDRDRERFITSLSSSSLRFACLSTAGTGGCLSHTADLRLVVRKATAYPASPGGDELGVYAQAARFSSPMLKKKNQVTVILSAALLLLPCRTPEPHLKAAEEEEEEEEEEDGGKTSDSGDLKHRNSCCDSQPSQIESGLESAESCCVNCQQRADNCFMVHNSPPLVLHRLRALYVWPGRS